MSQAFFPENPVDKAAQTAESFSNKLQTLNYGSMALNAAEKGYLKFGKSLGETGKTVTKFVLEGNKLEKLQKGWAEFWKGTTKDVKAADTAIGKLNKNITSLNNLAEKFVAGTLLVKGLQQITDSITKINAQWNKFEAGIKILGKSGIDPTMIDQITQFRDALTNLDASGVEEFATSAIAQYKQVTSVLAQIGTVATEEIAKSGQTSTQYLSKLFDDTQRLVQDGLKNTVSSIEALNATYVAFQAGITGSSATSAVENTLKLIVAQGGDAEGIMGLLAQTMTAFNISATESGSILGKLNEVVNVGITTIPELQNGFGQLGVSASAAGLSLDEVGGALAQMTLAGSNTYSAMTRLYNLFNQITSGQISERLTEMGATLGGQAIRLDAQTVKAKGFAAALKEVDYAIGGSKQRWRELLPDSEALAAVFGLLSSKTTTLADTINKVAKAGAQNLEKAFEIKLGEDQIQNFTQIANRAAEVMLKLGKLLAPVFASGIKFIEKTVDQIQYLVENYGELIKVVAQVLIAFKTLSAILGTIISTVFGLIGTWLSYRVITGKIVGDLGKFAGALFNLNKTISTTNILYDKNVGLLKKVAASLGQVLGIYNLEEASLNRLGVIESRNIDGKAKATALRIAGNEQEVKRVKELAESYSELQRIQNGGEVGNALNARDSGLLASARESGDNVTIGNLERKNQRLAKSKFDREQLFGVAEDVKLKDGKKLTKGELKVLAQQKGFERAIGSDKFRRIEAALDAGDIVSDTDLRFFNSIDDYRKGREVKRGEGRFSTRNRLRGIGAQRTGQYLDKVDDLAPLSTKIGRSGVGKFVGKVGGGIVSVPGGILDMLGDAFETTNLIGEGFNVGDKSFDDALARRRRGRQFDRRYRVNQFKNLPSYVGNAEIPLGKMGGFATKIDDTISKVGQAGIAFATSGQTLAVATAAVNTAFLGLAAIAGALAVRFIQIDNRNKKLAENVGAETGSLGGDLLESFGLLAKKTTEVTKNLGIFGEYLKNAFKNSPVGLFVQGLQQGVKVFNQITQGYDIQRYQPISDQLNQDSTITGLYTNSARRIGSRVTSGVFSDVDVEKRDASGKTLRNADGSVQYEKANLSTFLSNLQKDTFVSTEDASKLSQITAATQDDLARKLKTFEDQTSFIGKQQKAASLGLADRIGGKTGTDFVQALNKEAEAELINQQLRNTKLGERERNELRDRLSGLQLTDAEKAAKADVAKRNDASLIAPINDLKALSKALVESTDATAKFKKSIDAVSSALDAFKTYAKNLADFNGSEEDLKNGKTVSNNPGIAALERGLTGTYKQIDANVKNFQEVFKEFGAGKANEALTAISGKSDTEANKILQDKYGFSDEQIAKLKEAGAIFETLPNQIQQAVESNQTLIQNGAKSAEVAAKELRKRFIEDLPKGLRTPQQDLEFRKIEQDLFRQETETKLGRIESAKGALTPFADNPLLASRKDIVDLQKLEREAYDTRLKDAQRYYDYIKNQDGVLEADKKAALNEALKAGREYYAVLIKQEQQLTQDTIRRLQLRGSIEVNKLRANRLNVTGDITEQIARKQEDTQARTLQEELTGLERQRELIRQGGKDTLEIESQIAQKRVEIVEEYVNQVLRQYERLAKRQEVRLFRNQAATGGEEARLDVDNKNLESQTKSYDQGSRVVNIALQQRSKELDFVKETTRSERKRKQIANELLDIKQRTLNIQIRNEQATLSIQREQLKIQMRQMEIQQQRNELEAEVGLKQALIERDAVYKRGGTQEEKDIADSKVKIAEVGYRGALYGRAQLEAEKVLMENEQRIREYEAAINARSAQDDINIERAGLRGRRRTRNLASEIRNRPEIPLPNITLPDIKIDETSITNLINKITTESKRETDRVSAEIDKRKKQLQDDLSKQTDSKRIKVETIDQKILQDQLRYLETINNTITNVGKSVVDKIGDKPKPTDKDDKPKPKDKEDKPTPKPTLIVPPKEKLGSVESAFNYVIEQMGTYEGVDLRGVKKPTLRFANTKDDKLLAAGAGGYYNDKTNDIVLREVFRKGLEKGDTGAFEILTHELRHWMQDEGFVRTKKNLDDPRLTKDGRAESESGIKFSTRNGGNRDREEDAYVYDEIYGNKILANYIYAQRNRYKEGGKNAPLKTGKTVISPGLFTPPMTPSKGNKSEPFPFGGRNWKDISIEEMQAYWRRMGYEDDKSPQLPGSRFGNRNPGSYLKPQIKPPSNEIPYGAIVNLRPQIKPPSNKVPDDAIVNLRPQIKPPSNKIPYGAMVNWGSGILDQLKNNPDNRLFYERYKQNVKDNNLQAGINPRVRANYNDSTNPSSMKGYEYYAERLERSLNKGEITNDMADRMWQDVVVKGGLTNKSRREVYAQNQEKYGKSYAEQEKENKNNTVNFTPNITINVAAKDGEVGETIKSQLNDQLYNIFNETIRQLG